MHSSLPVNLQMLVESHDLPYQVIDADRRVVAVNRAFLDWSGRCAGEVLGESCFRLNHGRDQACPHYGDECPHSRVFGAVQGVSPLRPGRQVLGRSLRQIATPLTTLDGTRLMGKALLPPQDTSHAQPLIAGDNLAQLELRQIRRLLTLFDGNRRRVAERLGISERTLYRRLKHHGLS